MCNRMSVPKHRFIVWLVVQRKLQTTCRLAKIGVSPTGACLICGSVDESHHAHLFFKCHFGKKMFDCIQEMVEA